MSEAGEPRMCAGSGSPAVAGLEDMPRKVEDGRGWGADEEGTVGSKAPAWFMGRVVLLGRNHKSSTFGFYLFSFREFSGKTFFLLSRMQYK